jgi:hypothetical protein
MASEGWLASTRPSPRASFADGKRHVLVHFHIFKNAGMSVDRLLYESFGTGFQAYDPEDTETCIGERDVLEYLRSKSDVVAIAGHQLRFPLSGDTSIQLHPFLFLRDPIDRAHSIYYYERMDVRRETSNLPLTRKANELDFRQFVQWCLDRPGNGAPITNYQTRVCSILHNGSCAPDWYVWTNEINLRQALGFLSMLPFVGIVERFSESIDALVADYKYLFPMLRDVKFRENTTREHSSFPLERRHEIIRNELGGDLFRLLVGHNALDMELYRYGWQRLGGIR